MSAQAFALGVSLIAMYCAGVVTGLAAARGIREAWHDWRAWRATK